MRLTRNALPLAAAALVSACGSDDDFTEVRVMTQNLAVGIELEPVLLAPSFSAIPPLVEVAWQQKDLSDFAKRVDRIGAAIQASGADIVGLQEVIQFYDQIPPDGTPGLTPGATPATNLVKDFLALLLANLAGRGLEYAVVSDGTDQGLVSNADIELTGANESGPTGDYRVIDREAIIARSGVRIVDVRSANYVTRLNLQIGGSVPFAYKRGWVAVDAEKDGKAFTFVSTHLDPFDARVQLGQANELLGLLDSGRPSIVVGDINSEPNDTVWPAYGILVSPTTGFADAARDVGAEADTSGRDALCRDPADGLERRIDVVLHSPHFRTKSVAVYGASPADYDPVSQTWPSDHAGVSAALEIE